MKITPNLLSKYIKEAILEAKEKKEKAPKSSGKLLDLKRELEAMRNMLDEIKSANFSQKASETPVEFSNLAKYAKELDSIKARGVALENAMENKIKEIEEKINLEKNKIKEMIGLSTEDKGKKKIEDGAVNPNISNPPLKPNPVMENKRRKNVKK